MQDVVKLCFHAFVSSVFQVRKSRSSDERWPTLSVANKGEDLFRHLETIIQSKRYCRDQKYKRSIYEIVLSTGWLSYSLCLGLNTEIRKYMHAYRHGCIGGDLAPSLGRTEICFADQDF